MSCNGILVEVVETCNNIQVVVVEGICKCRVVVEETCKHRAVEEGTCRHMAVEAEIHKCKVFCHMPLHSWQSSILPRHRQDEAKIWPF